MTTTVTLHDTLALAHELHAGMNDWAGLPYITHPIAVMCNLPSHRPIDDLHLALLHDVVEDCKSRLAIKFNIPDEPYFEYPKAFNKFYELGYSDYFVQGLMLLTRDYWDFTYKNYVKNIVNSGHFGAMWVKLTDNEHNSDPHRRSRLSPEDQLKSLEMEKRYNMSKEILRKGLLREI